MNKGLEAVLWRCESLSVTPAAAQLFRMIIRTWDRVGQAAAHLREVRARAFRKVLKQECPYPADYRRLSETKSFIADAQVEDGSVAVQLARVLRLRRRHDLVARGAQGSSRGQQHEHGRDEGSAKRAHDKTEEMSDVNWAEAARAQKVCKKTKQK